MAMTKNICVFTATRAEYGLLYWLMKDLDASPEFNLQLIVSGTHLSKVHGHTVDKIHEDGFRIDAEVDLNLSEKDSRIDVAKAMSLATSGVAEALEKLQPDVFILLGDRYELLGAASAALLLDVPIFHLHGGELTEGAYDDSIRHAVTKMASWHGVAAQDYKNRVIQMGESPDRVFDVGALGLDNVKRLELLGKKELEGQLGFEFGDKTLLVTFHPVTNEKNPTIGFSQLLSVLSVRPELSVIFTHPNADHGRSEIIRQIDEFVEKFPNRSICFESLGQMKFLSTMKHIDVIAGNSSSGILEAPSFGVPTVNIGARQTGRIRAETVFDCENDVNSIDAAVVSALNYERQSSLISPFGDGDASGTLLKVLSKLNFERKTFQDITLQ
jgi:UDP-N-acetylglucosamine 2-epimerase (non-hydrolysing)